MVVYDSNDPVYRELGNFDNVRYSLKHTTSTESTVRKRPGTGVVFELI